MADHANRGIQWQRTIEQWNGTYRRERRAVVYTTPQGVRMIGRKSPGGRFVACFKGDGPPDFTGRAGPRPVCFDAKDCEQDSWGFDGLEHHQAQDLEAWSLDPLARAFIALRIAGVGWVLPWERLGPLWWAWHDAAVKAKLVGGRAARGTASLSLAQVAELGRRMPMPGDWLGALQ